MKKHFPVIDLFSGCGGFSCGLEQAGLEVVAGNDIWDAAGLTFAKNHPNSDFILGDIRDQQIHKAIVAKAKEKQCQVIVGGPPCQAYSMAGARNVDDERGHLFESYVKLVKEIRPKLFVMENVSGILTMRHDKPSLSPLQEKKMEKLKELERKRADLMLLRKKAKNTSNFTFLETDQSELNRINDELAIERKNCSDCRELVTEKITKAFKEIGYNIEFRLLNAADYGAPQKRERVIFVGVRPGIEISFPEATHCNPKLLDENVLFGKALKPWLTVRSAISDLENAKEKSHQAHWFTEHSESFVGRIKATKVGSSIYKGYSDAWYRNPPDEPSRTVKENHGGVLVHYEKHRVMTPRELARLQTFPDKFHFEGSKSDVLVQIGNAVPPQLGKAIGEHIKKILAQVNAPKP